MPSFDPNPQSNENHRVALILKIENIGVGVATDFEMEYYIGDDCERTTFKPQTISVKQPLYPIEKYNPQTPHKTELSFDVKGLPSIQKEYYSRHEVKLKGDLKCKDVFGKEHKFKRDLDVSAEVSEFPF